jgi:hypothetical protein
MRQENQVSKNKNDTLYGEFLGFFWTQFWKGAIQGPFHQSLVAIGPVVSEEKIKM